VDLGFDAKLFDPAAKTGVADETLGVITVHSEKGPSYVYSSTIILAINLALATRRPLSVAGKPGTGKTTLAHNVAHVLDAKYYQQVVTSRTRAKDLMWTFDSLRRLSDAQEHDKPLPPRAAYVQPQALWWAFDPTSARNRGATAREVKKIRPTQDPALRTSRQDFAVVLLDEIDKAEPDVPNDLLEVLDVERFTVDELDEPKMVEAKPDRVLIMITSNGERDLPPAFLRRCVVLTLEEPTEDWLVTIANDRFGKRTERLHREIAKEVMRLRELARERDVREPSTAEYLDAVRACKELKIDTTSSKWQTAARALLWKREAPQEVVE
jgi:MoxR-like ATPase